MGLLGEEERRGRQSDAVPDVRKAIHGRIPQHHIQHGHNLHNLFCFLLFFFRGRMGCHVISKLFMEGSVGEMYYIHILDYTKKIYIYIIYIYIISTIYTFLEDLQTKGWNSICCQRGPFSGTPDSPPFSIDEMFRSNMFQKVQFFHLRNPGEIGIVFCSGWIRGLIQSFTSWWLNQPL